jgi:hypothetical protein
LTKAQKAEQKADRERLRGWIKPGDTVYTVLRHVSRSGMQRSISLLVMHEGSIMDISGTAAGAMGDRFDRDQGGVKVGGCGMDMGFALVYELSYVLYPQGFGCIGKGCPSNDHSNGDRDYTKDEIDFAAGSDIHTHWHADGGYVLLHRWL